MVAKKQHLLQRIRSWNTATSKKDVSQLLKWTGVGYAPATASDAFHFESHSKNIMARVSFSHQGFARECCEEH